MQATEPRIPASQLQRFIAAAMEGLGLPGADAAVVAELMTEAEVQGSDGHGAIRLAPYVRRIKAGGINTEPNIRVVEERAAMALIDGDNAMGHLVMHFAAYAYVGESVTDPMKYYFNNVAATLHLLRCMIGCGVKKFVFSSTCATYGMNPKVPMAEDSVQDPCSPYARTKLTVEWMIRDFAHAYGLGFTLLRYFIINAGNVLSKPKILDHVWRYDFGGDVNVVESDEDPSPVRRAGPADRPRQPGVSWAASQLRSRSGVSRSSCG